MKCSLLSVLQYTALYCCGRASPAHMSAATSDQGVIEQLMTSLVPHPPHCSLTLSQELMAPACLSTLGRLLKFIPGGQAPGMEGVEGPPARTGGRHTVQCRCVEVLMRGACMF
jgi:hypothetical protein